MRKLKRDACIGIVGKRGTGKSTLVFDILHRFRRIPLGLAMSESEGANDAYARIIPRNFIYEEYNDKAVNHLLKYQKCQKMQNNCDKEMTPCAFLVVDDCMTNKRWHNTKSVKTIFKNGRHYNIFSIFVMQYALDIPAELRGCLDYIFIFKDNMRLNRQRIFQHYAGVFENLHEFCRVFDKLTEDYHCMVIDNTSKSNNAEDVIFYYKADQDKADTPFKMGCRDFWNYDPQSDNHSINA